MDIGFKLLGQSGCKLTFSDCVVYVDPYLSNSVEEIDRELKRLVEIPVLPEEIDDADWVLITHEHMDHCDPETLPVLAEASPSAKFVGPYGVLNALDQWGIDDSRLILAEESWNSISCNIKIHAVPAAHLEVVRNEQGLLECVGYVIDAFGTRIYIAGDTCVCEEVMATLKELVPIHVGILPVNERNYFKEQRGIIGNMSPREAFMLASALDIDLVIPVHWDMFAENSLSPEEISLVYSSIAPRFKLLFHPERLRICSCA